MPKKALEPYPGRMPTHPGAILRTIAIPATGLTIAEVAKRLGVTRQQLHRVLAEKAAISPEMALRLGKFCGNGPNLWLRMQQTYDLWHAQKKIQDELATIERGPVSAEAA